MWGDDRRKSGGRKELLTGPKIWYSKEVCSCEEPRAGAGVARLHKFQIVILKNVEMRMSANSLTHLFGVYN